MLATRRMQSASPTEVPPNFMTWREGFMGVYRVFPFSHTGVDSAWDEVFWRDVMLKQGRTGFMELVPASLVNTEERFLHCACRPVRRERTGRKNRHASVGMTVVGCGHRGKRDW